MDEASRREEVLKAENSILTLNKERKRTKELNDATESILSELNNVNVTLSQAKIKIDEAVQLTNDVSESAENSLRSALQTIIKDSEKNREIIEKISNQCVESLTDTREGVDAVLKNALKTITSDLDMNRKAMESVVDQTLETLTDSRNKNEKVRAELLTSMESLRRSEEEILLIRKDITRDIQQLLSDSKEHFNKVDKEMKNNSNMVLFTALVSILTFIGLLTLMFLG